MLYLNNNKKLEDAKKIYLNGKEVMGIYVGVPNKNLMRTEYEILTGTLNSYNQFGTSGFHMFIPIHQHGTYYYTLSQASGSNGAQIALANENKYIISGTRDSNTSSTVKTKQLSIDTSSYPTAKYVVVCWYYDTYDYHMVYLNDSSTTYVPYEWSRKKIYSGGEYTPLEYIETSTASGGYELPFIPTRNTHLEYTCAQTFVEDGFNSSSGDHSLLDCGWGMRMIYNSRYQTGQVNYNQTQLGYSIGQTMVDGYITMQRANIIGYLKPTTIIVQNRRVTVGSLQGTQGGTTAQPDKNLRFGGTDHAGNKTYKFAPWRIYEMKVFDTDENVIYDLIPVLKNSDGKPYLYDLINGVYYESINGVFPTNYAIKQ